MDYTLSHSYLLRLMYVSISAAPMTRIDVVGARGGGLSGCGQQGGTMPAASAVAARADGERVNGEEEGSSKGFIGALGYSP